MAFNSKGKYFMNPHHAKMSDGAKKEQPKEGSPKEEADEPKMEADAEGDDANSDVHEMLQNLHAKHGGTHMHVHKHEAGVTTHHVNEDGTVEGPHEHADTQAAADHMHMVMGGDGEPAMTGGAIPMGHHAGMSGY